MEHAPSVRSAARRAIDDLVTALDPGAFAPHHRHRRPVSEITREEQPHPLARVRTGVHLREALREECRAAALDARGGGESWESVAEALGLRSDDLPDADAAYLTLLGSRGASDAAPISVLWSCRSCGCAVRDLGPGLQDPTHRELGHASDCARHTRELITWRCEVQR